MKFIISFVAMTVVALSGFVGGRVDTTVAGWVTLQEAEAGAYRRSVRRSARRTARRTSRRAARRHNYYGGAAVVTAVAVGTVVSTLPSSCSTLLVDGVTYYDCSGTYYVRSGSQWVVVEAP